MRITPEIRQVMVAVSPTLAAVSVGGAIGYPGVLLQQFRAANSTIELDLDTASWIGSLHGIAGIPSILMPIIMQWKGRKCAYFAATSFILIGWILAYTASSIKDVLISECFHGLGTNSISPVSMLSMGEMLDPQYRHIFVQIYMIIQVFGLTIVGIMTRYVHWKTISAIMGVLTAMALIMASVWPESPSWLASKGEFDKCKHAFKLLRGTNERSAKELKRIIDAQRNACRTTENLNCRTGWRVRFFKTLTRKDFYLPAIHIYVLLNTVYWSGSLVVLIYSSELIEKLTLSSNAAFNGGLILNLIWFIDYSITAVILKLFNINSKSVLLLSIFATTMCLLGTSVVSYMQSIEIVPRDSMVCLYWLIAYVVCSSLGLNTIVYTVAAELMPVKHRGLGGFLYVMYICSLHSSSLKLSPYLFKYLNMYGTFSVFTINTAVCGFIIWKYVPETKGRSLQDIENYYNHGRFITKQIDEDVNSCLNVE